MSHESKVKVHFVAHSHMDTGWLRTFDDYYTDKASEILQNVVQKLTHDPSLSYTIGDIAYLKRYYTDAEQ